MECGRNSGKLSLGRAMAPAVGHRPLTAEAWVRSRVSPCGICGGQSGKGTGFPPEYCGFVLPISIHRCSITRKNEKTLIFITGLHNKPQGCGASVASAAGPLKKELSLRMSMDQAFVWRDGKKIPKNVSDLLICESCYEPGTSGIKKVGLKSITDQ
jgi:hypothetical protein